MDVETKLKQLGHTDPQRGVENIKKIGSFEGDYFESFMTYPSLRNLNNSLQQVKLTYKKYLNDTRTNYPEELEKAKADVQKYFKSMIKNYIPKELLP